VERTIHADDPTIRQGRGAAPEVTRGPRPSGRVRDGLGSWCAAERPWPARHLGRRAAAGETTRRGNLAESFKCNRVAEYNLCLL